MKPIPKHAIEKMKEAYERTIRKSSTENLKKNYPEKPWIEESKSLWVSRKELLALLDDNKANGLRIYFGCHHESTHEDPKLDMLGLHTAILVATVDTVNPGNPTTENSKDQLSEHAADKPGDYSGSGGDNAPICPPSC